MSYLGLGPEDTYDDYDLPPVEHERPAPRRPASQHDVVDSGAIRTVPVRSTPPRTDREPNRSGFSPLDDSGATPIRRVPQQGSAVRAVPTQPAGRPYTVRPRSFDQAKEIGDRFRDAQAVIVNLEGIDRDLTRRLIDFSAGLIYGLNGTMEKVASGVYLLTPANVMLSAEDRRHASQQPDDEY